MYHGFWNCYTCSRIWLALLHRRGVPLLIAAIVKTYSGLLATRFFLGLAEAGIFPGGIHEHPVIY
jgi:hypothetical protein